MSTSAPDIILNPNIYDHTIEHSILLSIWDELSHVSAEVTMANYPSLSEFVNNHCLYFAAIQAWISPGYQQRASRPPLFEMNDQTAEYPTVWNTVPTFENVLSTSLPHQSEARPWSAKSQRDKNDEHGVVPSPTLKTIGLIFLTPSHMTSEVSICLGLLPNYRRKGFGTAAVQSGLRWAFDDIQCHRVQALLLDSPQRDRALRLFTAFGFAHEGTRRREVMSAGGWHDVTYMGMLDTEWLVRERSTRAPRSMWDELFQRHQKEREELLRWEQVHRLKRSASMETVREAARPTPVRQAPRPTPVVRLPEAAAKPPADTSAAAAQPPAIWHDVQSRRSSSSLGMRELLAASSPPGSTVESFDSEWDSASIGSGATLSDGILSSRSPSPTSSQSSEWALLETSSAPPSNELESFWYAI